MYVPTICPSWCTVTSWGQWGVRIRSQNGNNHKNLFKGKFFRQKLIQLKQRGENFTTFLTCLDCMNLEKLVRRDSFAQPHTRVEYDPPPCRVIFVWGQASLQKTAKISKFPVLVSQMSQLFPVNIWVSMHWALWHTCGGMLWTAPMQRPDSHAAENILVICWKYQLQSYYTVLRPLSSFGIPHHRDCQWGTNLLNKESEDAEGGNGHTPRTRGAVTHKQNLFYSSTQSSLHPFSSLVTLKWKNRRKCCLEDVKRCFFCV